MSVYQRKLYALMHQELQDQNPLACYGNNLDQLQNWWQQLVDQQEQSQVLPNAIDQRSRYAMKRSFRQRRSLVPLTGLI
ncbi:MULTISPECIES: hypothetical protein [unclassified Moorena]|uniref:hypothetical protein n=1 Tax=unclassified Moorena TaxID=2683338 RepID=UPI0013FEF3E7|nr:MULTISPECIES: hypothetical protein [unclassified Moorena]NEO11427.1 hypothetical protein [Moorena sp. SIO3E8]NEP99264.1 hypothetical protein [Moorena sp. SIO3F7]